MDCYDYTEQELRSDLKASLKEMYEHGGTNMELYDFYAKCAYALLKELSMMISSDEFKVLEHKYYCAIYDGEWDDATKPESEEV